MKFYVCIGVLILSFLRVSHAQVEIHPTTTLAALTENNTSASSSYSGAVGSNAAPGNISNLPIRTLLYSGATTKIYAHLMGWFGGPGHIDVGYTSSDPAQIHKQVGDMVQRGIDGVIVSWDTNAMVQKTVPLVLRESESHPGFEFAVELEEFGFRQFAQTAACDITDKVIEDLTQAATQFENSPAYMRIEGRPVVFFFGLEKYYVDWTRVREEAPGHPIFIFRNSTGFTKTESDGAFAWSDKSKTDPYDEMLGYLDDFYKAALASPTKAVFGSAFAGFNDAAASWGANKIMDRHCGQTWLDSLARAGRFYSSSNQLPALRLVTWNDYEEGTAIEPGVDNCVTVSTRLSGSTLGWSLTGNTNTIDHITVYVSNDGQNLMTLKDLPATSRSLDLSTFNFASGSYVLYVRAVAKAGILNKISGPVKFVPGDPPPIAELSLSASSGTVPFNVNASTSSSSDPGGTIASSVIDFGDGTVIAGPVAQHTYSVPGTYTVQAMVYDGAGVSTSVNRQVVANPVNPGVTIASPDDGANLVSPVRVQASVASAQPIQNMSIWIDGARVFTTFTNSADRKFGTRNGSHTILVQATDASGTVLQATRSIVTQTPDIAPLAVLSIDPISGGSPNQVLACTAASSDPDDSISSYLVNFGDGSTASGLSLVHTYKAPGTYNVEATVTDGRGVSSTSVQTINVGTGSLSGSNASSGSSFRLSATMQASAATAVNSQSYTVQVSPVGGNFSGEVALSCSGVPAGVACSFTPSHIAPGVAGASATLVIAPLQSASTKAWSPLSALAIPGFGLVLLGVDPRRWRKLLSMIAVGVMAMILITGCGNGPRSAGQTGSSGQTSSGTITVTILGTSGTTQSSTTVQYTMR